MPSMSDGADRTAKQNDFALPPHRHLPPAKRRPRQRQKITNRDLAVIDPQTARRTTELELTDLELLTIAYR